MVLGISCKSPLDPTHLYDTYKDAVVLIYNSYYFETSLDNGIRLFYTIKDEEVQLHLEESEAINNAMAGYGTGFFISSKGEIATNRHVVYPAKEEYLVVNQIQRMINNIKDQLRRDIIVEEKEATRIADHLEYNYNLLDRNEIEELRDKYEESKQKITELEAEVDKLYFNPENTETKVKRLKLGIAYNGTHISSMDDYVDCIAIKESPVEVVDLAIIQLKSGKTPNDITYYFNVDDIEVSRAGTNHEVYLIGYNHGMSLAQTQYGIKSQFTQGRISQDPDQNRVLYSIPSLPGSSGGPVLDGNGDLVAINFAGVRNSQSFNLGIPAIALYNLYYDIPNIEFRESSLAMESGQGRSTENQQSGEDLDYFLDKDFVNTIQKFVEAEDRRDFDLIYSHFSDEMNRYYDIINPSYAEIRAQYDAVWKSTPRSRHEIESIDEINDYIYDLKSTIFYSDMNNKQNREDINVRFIFNTSGEIIELYSLDNISKPATARNLPAPLHMLNKGYETSKIEESSYNLTTRTYSVKQESPTPALLFLALDTYYFKRGSENWRKASWTYSHFDTQHNGYVFKDSYDQEIILADDGTSLTWLTNKRNRNIYYEKITYQNMASNPSVRLGLSNLPEGKHSRDQNASSTSKKGSSVYAGSYLYKTGIRNLGITMPIYVRAKPAASSKALYECPRNATIYVLERSRNNYTRVYVDGYFGYISSQLLELAN